MPMVPEKATIVAPDGTPAEKPATLLTYEEAELLKAYQAWGNREGLAGQMYCGACKKQMEVYVQADIGFFCDCRVLYWRAS